MKKCISTFWARTAQFSWSQWIAIEPEHLGARQRKVVRKVGKTQKYCSFCHKKMLLYLWFRWKRPPLFNKVLNAFSFNHFSKRIKWCIYVHEIRSTWRFPLNPFKLSEHHFRNIRVIDETTLDEKKKDLRATIKKTMADYCIVSVNRVLDQQKIVIDKSFIVRLSNH